MVNAALAALLDVFGAPVTLQRLFALAFRPLIGVDGADIDTAARLLGTKTVLNEFVAYIDLASLPENDVERAFSPHSVASPISVRSA
jgi:CNT family concentrative nucleoside transporter